MSYRFPGVKSFETEDKEIFKGRDNAIRDLHTLVRIEKTILLYSRSGLGKTSLINAGLITVLKDDSQYRFDPIVVRLGYCPQKTSDGNFADEDRDPRLKIIKQMKVLACGSKLLEQSELFEDTLSFLMKAIQMKDTEKTQVLIFDQFEDLFTYSPKKIEELKKDLYDLLYVRTSDNLRDKLLPFVNNNPEIFTDEQLNILTSFLNIRMIFVIRSDYLSKLNMLTDMLPGLQNTFYELKPLTEAEAREAITGPAMLSDPEKKFECPEFKFDNATVDKILDAVRDNDYERTIETFQLQIVCQHVENLVMQNNLKIVFPKDIGNVKDIIQSFFDNEINNLPTRDEEERSNLRRLLEDEFILPSEGTRQPVLKESIDPEKISEDTLSALEKTCLIRKEPYHNSYIYELSHDTLVMPILDSLRIRKAEEKIKEAEAENKKKRNKYLLIALIALFSIAIVAAIGWANYKSRMMTKIEKEKNKTELANLVANQEKQKAIEAEKIAVVEKDKAQEAEKQALELKRKAEEARSDAIREKEIATAAKITAENEKIKAEQATEVAEMEKFRAEFESRNAIREKARADSLLKISDNIISQLYFYNNKFALAVKKTKGENEYGFIDKQGNIMIGFKYKEAYPFDENTGFAKVRDSRDYFLIDTARRAYRLAEDLEQINLNTAALNFQSKHLTEIPNKIFYFTQLKILLLSDNSIKQISPNIITLSDSLFFLDLSNNKINACPAELWKLQGLKVLNLSRNPITIISEDIENLANLMTLNLENDEIKSIPASLGGLSNLTLLNLSDNNLTSLPSEMGRLANLINLNLSKNKLISVPIEIGSLTSLSKLNLSSNQLKSVPAELGNIEKLTELNISDNQLADLPLEIWNLKNLVKLELANNKLIVLLHEIGQMANLIKLNLMSNDLEAIPIEIGDLVNLTELNLSHNSLHYLPEEVGNMKNLTELKINNNQLTSLPGEIGMLENLTSLDISNNQLESLPKEITLLRNLKELNLTGTNLPEELISEIRRQLPDCLIKPEP